MYIHYSIFAYNDLHKAASEFYILFLITELFHR